MMLFDSHCHLDFEAFDPDREQVLERAHFAGVVGILNPSVDLENSSKVVALSACQAPIFAAVGVHPNSATSWKDEAYSSLFELARQPKVLAIGEIGLDYYRDRAPRQLQITVFEHQLDLAGKMNLPVIIHTRDLSPGERQATADVLAILAQWQAELAVVHSPLLGRAGVLHSYSGDLESAKAAIEMGFYIGITGPVTFRNAPDLQRIVAELPLERLLIETDAPFLTPHPHRGKRNEPAYVRLVADKIALLQNLEPALVAQTTTENAERLFNWRVNH
jgi:TatD DNase family protein